MKKITLLLILLTVSFGYSQNIPVTFETDMIVGAKDGTVSPTNAKPKGELRSLKNALRVSGMPSPFPSRNNVMRLADATPAPPLSMK